MSGGEGCWEGRGGEGTAEEGRGRGGRGGEGDGYMENGVEDVAMGEREEVMEGEGRL